MSDTTAILKQLKIKSGVIQRYVKEAALYRQEVEDLRKKSNSFVAGETEDWTIKNTKRMTEESEKMILDTENRLRKAIGELSDLVKQVQGRPDVAETQEFKSAQAIIEQA